MKGGQADFLDIWLTPLAHLMMRPQVCDIHVNRPGIAWVETVCGESEKHEIPELDEAALGRLARQVAARSHQGISRAHPLLAASLPDGSRIQIIAPPATREGMAMSIRRHVVRDLSLTELVGSAVSPRSVASPPVALPQGEDNMARWLARLVHERRNVLISGGTASGKTTLLNALLREIPPRERLIVIEDTPELVLPLPNALGLIARRSELGEASVDAEALVQASLRMRPDRIIMGELRGAETLAWLRAVNTGHPGSLATVHASSAQTAVGQLALIAMQAGSRWSRSELLDYLTSVIDVVVQVERSEGQSRIAGICIPAKDLPG
ncbi:MAG TPA: P-type DNA transfer ATPase VirB11 [Novosphingobium sp.]|nr:P-type DNA transfer ATPase VirB11 [Novosphingobium sp.]